MKIEGVEISKCSKREDTGGCEEGGEQCQQQQENNEEENGLETTKTMKGLGGGGEGLDSEVESCEEDDIEEEYLLENPMLNHLIVGNILRWLPIHHLLKTRLVCKLWAHEASKVLRQSATVTLISHTQDNQMLRFLDTMINCSNCPSSSSTTTINNSTSSSSTEEGSGNGSGSSSCTSIPYSQFQVRYDDKLPTEPAALYREYDFFRLLGGNLTHLTLDFLEEVDANLSANLLRDLFLCNVPNLVFLAIDLPATTTCDPALLPSPPSVVSSTTTMDQNNTTDNGISPSTTTTTTTNTKNANRRKFTYLFPRLQTLLIVDFLDDQNRHDLRIEERERYSPGFLKDLLTTAPRLNKFSFLTRSPILMSRVVTSLNCLALGALTQLHLDGTVSNVDIKTLTNHPLPLQSLRLRCLKGDVTKSTLENLLYTQRKTLKELCIGDRCDYEEEGGENNNNNNGNGNGNGHGNNMMGGEGGIHRIAIQLPLMEKLQIMTLLRRCLLTAGRYGKIRFSTTPYTKYYLPVIIKLSFDTDFPDDAFEHLEDFFPPMNLPCTTIKELNFCCPIAQANLYLIRSVISKYFPNVEKIKMSKVTSEFTNIISIHMRNILELYIYFPHFETNINDKPSLMSLCIKLQIRNCKIIQVLRNPRNFMMYTIIIINPCIGNLKKLQRVVIETRSLRTRVQDATVLSTFTHLRILHFNRKIGLKYREALTRTLPFVRLEESLFSDSYKWN